MKAIDIMLIPAINSDWETIAAFAITFNGYEFVGGGPKELSNLCDKVSLAPEKASMEELRACLFLSQRAGRFCGDEGSDYDLEEGRSLLDLMHRME